jgi:phage shock protein E
MCRHLSVRKLVLARTVRQGASAATGDGIAAMRSVRFTCGMRFPFFLVVLTLAFAGGALAEEPKPAAPAAPATEKIQKNVTPDEAEKLIQQKKDLIVLDVRTSDEFADGHIAGAQNLDFFSSDFATKLAALDPTKSYLVHCQAGGRSSKAVELMRQHNFGEVYHLKDGFHAWAEAGKPVTK